MESAWNPLFSVTLAGVIAVEQIANHATPHIHPDATIPTPSEIRPVGTAAVTAHSSSQAFFFSASPWISVRRSNIQFGEQVFATPVLPGR